MTRDPPYPVRWVLLKKYCELTGDTRGAVHKRRAAGIWLDGRHCQIKRGRLWVNLPAVDRWVEQEHTEVR